MQSEMNYIVYKHTAPNGKTYVGITKNNPEKRWGKNGCGYRGLTHFAQAIQKYGWENFSHEILFIGLSKEEACDKEIILISHYKAFNLSYNMTDGGDGVIGLDEETRKKMGHDQHGDKNTFYNHKHTEETKKIIGEKSKGRSVSEETRKKLSDKLKGKKKPPRTDEHKHHLSEANKGKKLSEETKQKLSKINKGKKLSNEHKEKISESNKGKKYPSVAKLKSIPIVQCNLNETFVAFWSSAKEAADIYGFDRSKIAACCNEKRKSTGGYKWFYLSKYKIKK